MNVSAPGPISPRYAFAHTAPNLYARGCIGRSCTKPPSVQPLAALVLTRPYTMGTNLVRGESSGESGNYAGPLPRTVGLKIIPCAWPITLALASSW